MSIKQRLLDDMKEAMRARQSARLGCIRMLKSKIQEREVALRATKGVGYELEDEEALEVVSAYAKQRRDSIRAYEDAGREDLAAKEKAELEMIAVYLPEQLCEEDLRAIVSEAVAESGASSPREMGVVMKLVMPRVKGRADGKQVNAVVSELLQG